MKRLWLTVVLGSVATFSGCMVGPKYQRPSAPAPVAFKEPPPGGWKEAQPNDGVIRGKWWEMFNDPQLNALEEQVNISNQNVLAAEAQYRQARDVVRIARSSLFPTVTAGTSIITSRAGGGFVSAGPATSATTPTGSATTSSSTIRTIYDLPVDISYQADVWGSIRRTVRQDIALAQASEAQLENARLSYQALLAEDYFNLRGLDGQKDLLEETVKSYEEFLELTRNRFAAGVASGADVAQAETQLETTRAALVDLGVARTQYEHAIAVLTGKPPASLEIPYEPIKSKPPVVPVAVPSALLERRPDIAAYERQVAAQNEAIGVAQAAFYPTLSLTASAGLESTSFTSWFTWPARFWSVGPQLAETLFDAGRRRAIVQQERDLYDATVANYRQSVLTAFQQVEDNLSALRVLENEAGVTEKAVASAEQALEIATSQYKAGTTDYLNVITTQAALLGNERTQVDLLTRRMTSSVLLVEALGGGWNASTLPTPESLTSKK